MFLECYLVVKQTFLSHSCGRNKEIINERWAHPDEELNVGPMSERPTEDQCIWKVKLDSISTFCTLTVKILDMADNVIQLCFLRSETYHLASQ